MVKKAHTSRNPQLVRGVGKFSRSVMYHKRGLWAIKAKNGGALPVHAKAAVPEPPKTKAPRFYPADDVPKPMHKRSTSKKPAKLRASITPGKVLILLAGRFKGKRVVFLKQLESGLLLVTGPYKLNGVPLRRVNQVYVIATSTSIDISGVDVSQYKDAYFKKDEQKKKRGENDFFETEEEKKELPAERKEDQKKVDSQLMAIIEKVPDMKNYLGARFTLTRGMKPHELVF